MSNNKYIYIYHIEMQKISPPQKIPVNLRFLLASTFLIYIGIVFASFVNIFRIKKCVHQKLSKITNGKDDIKSVEQHRRCYINNGHLGKMVCLMDILQSYSLALRNVTVTTMEMATSDKILDTNSNLPSTPSISIHLSSILLCIYYGLGAPGAIDK